ncbi:MAG: hypothetical protein K8S13_11215 [Desulfobacula sp.]|uniref:hypothetical protein n=1 Tax=Desulfobacula sp. TaxID=2593537 RepID=UPI0025BBA9EC|nr:hypothetical protein [Desulfobacula sp.]MCD4720410.1 hypothetical protein [Desulfobacula sp.]
MVTAEDIFRKIKDLIIYALMAWPFIWDNANKLTMKKAFGIHVESGLVFNFLPDETKYLEAIILFFLFAVLLIDKYIFHKKIELPFLKYLFIALLIASCTQIANGIINNNLVNFKTYDLLYKFYRPLILFTIIYYFASDPYQNMIKVNLVFFFFIGLNVLIAIYQILTYTYGVDMVTGFMRSAHTLGIILLYFMVAVFFYLKEKPNIISLLCFVLSMTLFLYTSNVKLVFLLFFTIFAYTIFDNRIQLKKSILYIVVFLLLFFLTRYIILRFNIQGFDRIENLLKYPLIDYPIIKTIYYIPVIFKENFCAPFLMGFGHGYFDNADIIIFNLDDLQARELIYYKYKKLFLYLKIHGNQIELIPITMLLVPFSSALCLLYEEGFVAFALYLYMFYLTFVGLKKIRQNNKNLPKFYIETVWFIFLLSMLNILIIPGANVIANITFLFPLLINLGLLFKYQTTIKNKKFIHQ